MKKILFVLALVISTLTVSYAYPADQGISRAGYTYVDFQNQEKTLDAKFTSSMHYTMEIRNYGKAFIWVYGTALQGGIRFDLHTSGKTYPTWKNSTFTFSNEYIGKVKVEVQLDPAQGTHVYSEASSRWEW